MDALALAQAALFVIPLALSLVVQAYARAQVADWLGDDTPRRDERLTLNPAAHVDPIGTFVLPMSLFLLQGAGAFLPLLGWAKPVAVRTERMRRRFAVRTLEMLVAIASPGASVMLALLSALAVAAFVRAGPTAADAAVALGVQLMTMNVALAIFQMLPIGPLAGFTVLLWLLPRAYVGPVTQWNDRYGQWALLGLLLFGRGLLSLPMRFVAGALWRVVGAG